MFSPLPPGLLHRFPPVGVVYARKGEKIPSHVSVGSILYPFMSLVVRTYQDEDLNAASTTFCPYWM